MTNATVTRVDLCERIVAATGLSRAVADRLLRLMLDEIEAAIVREGGVKLARFGNFQVRDKKARVGRNPKTKEAAPISARRVVTFRPSQTLKERVNRGPQRGR